MSPPQTFFGIEPPQTPPPTHHDDLMKHGEAPPLTPPPLADQLVLIPSHTEPLPTPAPSPQPRPVALEWHNSDGELPFGPRRLPLTAFINYVSTQFSHLDAPSRRAFLSSLLPLFSAADLLHTSHLITPLLKRDFLTDLPAEISLHILSFVDDARDLVRASQVCKSWRRLVGDEQTWKEMCKRHRFAPGILRPGSFAPISRTASPAAPDYAPIAQSDRPPDAEEVLVDGNDQEAQEISWALQGLGIGTQTASTVGSARFASPSPIPLVTPSALPTSPLSLLRTAPPSRAQRLSSSSPESSQRRRVSPNPEFTKHFPKSSPLTARTMSDQQQWQTAEEAAFSYKMHFKKAYLTESNWLRGPGRLLSTQASNDDGVVTSLGFDAEWIIVGMATSKVHVFDAETGAYVRTLAGHELGVWSLTLVSRGGVRVGPNGRPVIPGDREGEWIEIDDSPSDTEAKEGDDKGKGKESLSGLGMPSFSSSVPMSERVSSMKVRNVDSPNQSSSSRKRRSSFHASPASSANGQSPANVDLPADWASGLGIGDAQQASLCGTARGWGQPGAVVVSGGCDRDVRVWDVDSGICRYVLRGHTSTIRCLKVLDGRPIAVSGSRDATLRVWDIERGTQLHVLVGHQHSVRCMEVSGNKVVSGSYDTTCRLWDIDTGECLFVFRGHFHQIYAVAFDGQRVATGSLDSTVRIWSARTGDCLALLQGHTSLVGQLQLTDSVLVTGGSDGRVIVFSLATLECVHRLCAHDNSVTCLQWSPKFLVTGGNDGRVKLFDSVTGAFIRLLAPPCEAVWRVLFTHNRCVIVCKRDGRTVMDVIDFSPS